MYTSTQKENEFAAPIYDPFDIVIDNADGCWLFDIHGNKYLDCLASYSAMNAGHNNKQIIDAAIKQMQKLTVTSRAIRNTVTPELMRRLCELSEQEQCILMNTGAEAVETSIKLARKWGYEKKRIPPNCAKIIVCDNNFHGRTSTIVGFSSVPQYRDGFGPYADGFVSVPFGDEIALIGAISPTTCAFLFEPIQSEGGMNVPPDGYLGAVREICTKHNILMIADEVQTGMGRTGRLFESYEKDVKPDVLLLGKALGSIYPVSAILSSKEIMSVMQPYSHGSTFGGNPLGAAIAIAYLNVMEKEFTSTWKPYGKGHELMLNLKGAIATSPYPNTIIRGRGLLIGIQTPFPAADLSAALLRHGVVAKNSRDDVLRITPPLTISYDEIKFLTDAFSKALNEV